VQADSDQLPAPSTSRCDAAEKTYNCVRPISPSPKLTPLECFIAEGETLERPKWSLIRLGRVKRVSRYWGCQ